MSSRRTQPRGSLTPSRVACASGAAWWALVRRRRGFVGIVAARGDIAARGMRGRRRICQSFASICSLFFFLPCLRLGSFLFCRQGREGPFRQIMATSWIAGHQCGQTEWLLSVSKMIWRFVTEWMGRWLTASRSEVGPLTRSARGAEGAPLQFGGGNC